MQTLWRSSFLEKYKSAIKNWSFPRPTYCAKCKTYHTFHRHGYYYRNVVDDDWEDRIPVLRFCCKVCNSTISILPDILLPYFQYPLQYILNALCIVFGVASGGSRQFSALFRFYKRRFIANVTKIEMFFRESDCMQVIKPDKKEKTIKLVCMLRARPRAETFSRRFHAHYKHNFMAH